jgi:hypothetical protein
MNSCTWVASLALFLLSPPLCAAPEPLAKNRLNDTGVTQCVRIPGQWTSTAEATGQDAAYGRDVKVNSPLNGFAGFSFRKICNSGAASARGVAQRIRHLGSGPNDWACTRDKATGLIWEMKTDDGGLHDKDSGYAFDHLAPLKLGGLCDRGQRTGAVRRQ